MKKLTYRTNKNMVECENYFNNVLFDSNLITFGINANYHMKNGVKCIKIYSSPVSYKVLQIIHFCFFRFDKENSKIKVMVKSNWVAKLYYTFFALFSFFGLLTFTLYLTGQIHGSYQWWAYFLLAFVPIIFIGARFLFDQLVYKQVYKYVKEVFNGEKE